MWIGVVSLFPAMFAAVTGFGIAGRAVAEGRLTVEFWNPRDYTADRHRTVDAKPYGGGPGMLMMAPPLAAAIAAAKAAAPAVACKIGAGTLHAAKAASADASALRGVKAAPAELGASGLRAANAGVSAGGCKVVCLTPQGRRLEQAGLNSLAQAGALVLVAGRYEGIDERVLEALVDEEVSIGDYVLAGGELPAMVLIEGISRLLPGAVGDADSVASESFMDGLLDYPQYTRPEEALGQRVPEVLLSGDHAAINSWRRMQALGRTRARRPDLFASLALSEADQRLLSNYEAHV